MCRREVMDDFLRKRAAKFGANVVNGLMMRMEQPEGAEGPIKIHYNSYESSAGAKAVGPKSAPRPPATARRPSAKTWRP